MNFIFTNSRQQVDISYIHCQNIITVACYISGSSSDKKHFDFINSQNIFECVIFIIISIDYINFPYNLSLRIKNFFFRNNITIF